MIGERGIFILSLDFELIWGTLDRHGQKFRHLCDLERLFVIERLLNLFTEFDISATWCTVGHLFLKECRLKSVTKHPDIARLTFAGASQDRFSHDPCSTEQTDPVFYGRTLVEKIMACRVQQEIGCHSFSHVIFSDARCTRAVAESELQACLDAARELGIDMKSFAFPRNRVGHLPVLRSYGFTCYRGPEPHWYQHKMWPHKVKRLGQLIDVLTARRPPTVVPEQTPSGLWNIPGSMLFTPSHGIRKHLPVSLRVKRARKGLDAAVRDKRIFHLWFHPTDLAGNLDPMLAGLRQVLEYAAELRSRNELDILPMGAIASVQDPVIRQYASTA
ncbi:MAG: hypothetical protein M3Y27_25035 [Acidobacteriota bacterium]|nr:hypothetical protein [Acidobacteriota bacterium]